MKTTMCLVAVALLTLPAGLSLADEGAVKAPATGAVLVVPETDFNFGYAPQNAKIGHVYWLRNAGTDTLKVLDVKPGCGCTKAPIKKKFLAPGDSTEVEVIFSTGMYSNKTRKSASIMASVSGQIPSLNFSAHPVKSPDSLEVFTLNPPRLNLDSVAKAEGGYDVAVRNKTTSPIEFSLVSIPNEFVSIELPKGPVAPGADLTLHVNVDPKGFETGFSKSFTIQSSDTASTRYSFPIEKTAPPKTAAATTTTPH